MPRIFYEFGEEGKEKRLHDYTKFIGPLHELVSHAKPRIRNIRAKLFRSRATRFLLPRATLQLVRAHRRSVSCLIANAPGGLWDAGMTRRQSSRSFSPSRFFTSLQVRPSVGYADIVSSKGLSLAHLEATRVSPRMHRESCEIL